MDCSVAKKFFKKNFDMKKSRIFAPAKREKLRIFNILQADFSAIKVRNT